MADSKWMQRLEGVLGDIAVRSHQRPTRALILAGVLTAVGGYFSNKLPMVADLEKLLPDTFDSVKDLEPVKERFGGIGYIVVVGMDAEPEQLKAFADDYAPRIAKEMPGIRYVEHKRAGQFFEDRSLYYLSLDDVKEVEKRIKDRERYARRMANPMLLQLEEEEPPSLDMSDIEAKYGKRSDQRLASGGDYFLDEKEKMIVMLAKPEHTAVDLSYSERLVNGAEDYLKKQDFSKYGKDFKVQITGTFKYKVDQQRQLTNDMTRATLVAFILLIGYLIFHFRGILPVFFVLVPTSLGLVWTYGITYFVFGSINILTGFLGAVLGGLGTEHGIHLIGRYGSLRTEGVSSEDATRDAFMTTGGSAIVSSVVAALTFLAVAFSEFRAFREFGVIAAVGMIVVITAYFIILPAALGLVARFGWKPKEVHEGKSELSRMLPKYFRPISIGGVVLLAVLMVEIPGVRFDYDFKALEDSTLPCFVLDKRINKILGYNMEPVVILTKEAKTERLIVDELKKRQKEQGAASTVDFVAAMDDLVPPQQAEKQEIFRSIKKTLDRVKPASLDPETRAKHASLQRWVSAEPFGRQDIPMSVRRQFEGIKPSNEGFVLIFPNILLSDGKQVVRFAQEVRGVQLPNGERVSAAGEPMILADILLMVLREAKPILFGAIFAVLLAMWITLGSLGAAIVCMLPTVVSVLGQVGLMTVLKTPFNYLNILLVPILIGTTVDAGVHLISRIRESHLNFPPVFAETGRAIVGGLITSVVGFSAMLLADHPGLNSMGRVAILGFSLNLVVMLLFFPAWLLWLQQFGLFRDDLKPGAGGDAPPPPAPSGTPAPKTEAAPPAAG
ncbi:MAG: MMPL family transporter [Myxococcales bacterium]